MLLVVAHFMGSSSTVFGSSLLSCGGRMTWLQPKSNHPKLSHRLSHRFCSSAVLYSAKLTAVLWSNDTGNERGDASHNLTFPSSHCYLLFRLPAEKRHWRFHLRKIFSTDHLQERKTETLIIVLTASACFYDFGPIKSSFWNSQYASSSTKLQSNGITNLENVEENGNNFSTRHIPFSSLLELVHLLLIF